MLPGMLSGVIQNALGYTSFFITILVLTIPGMILLFFIPLEEDHTNKEKVDTRK